MDRQSVFNQMIEHLVEQGEPAIDSEYKCVYRTSSGKMCAIGCLIPDDKYDPDFEGSSASDIAGMVLPFPLHGDDPTFLDECQTCLHDRPSRHATFLRDMRSEAKRLAYKYDLKVPECIQ